MPLIQCPECLAEISSLAPNCPKCGAPIASQVITTQQTARKFKGHMLIGALLCCLGVILIVAPDEYTPGGALLFLIGLVWFLVARARAWWNNG